MKFDGVQNVSTPTMFLQLQDGKAQAPLAEGRGHCVVPKQKSLGELRLRVSSKLGGPLSSLHYGIMDTLLSPQLLIVALVLAVI